jgi:ABC-type Fe3+ transport system permease subunit
MYAAIRPVGGSAAEIWPIYLLPLALSGIAIALGWVVCHQFPATRLGDWGKLIGITLISAAVYVPAVRRLARDSWDELLQRVRGLAGAAKQKNDRKSYRCPTSMVTKFATTFCG